MALQLGNISRDNEKKTIVEEREIQLLNSNTLFIRKDNDFRKEDV